MPAALVRAGSQPAWTGIRSSFWSASATLAVVLTGSFLVLIWLVCVGIIVHELASSWAELSVAALPRSVPAAIPDW